MEPIHNKAFLGAYRKGRKAYELEGAEAQCPYPDKRGGIYDHVITYSRAFQKYWREGFEDAQSFKPVRYFFEPKEEESE